MTQKMTVLFDMDGVVIDTEPQYDIIWREIGLKFLPEIKDLGRIIKGTTMPNILKNYFSNFPASVHKEIEEMVAAFELRMDFFEIAGSIDFIKSLKAAGIKTGLVTSSGEEKVEAVYDKLSLAPLFDTLVTSSRVAEGKPHPMCYLLAAKDLGVDPSTCFVLEDSFAGIASGRDAGMKLVGLSTTNSAASLESLVLKVIPDFKNFALSDLEALV
ncbi:phosphatase [Bacteroidales bacterium]|nr:phosphatase [Bacteroidales bacterium]